MMQSIVLRRFMRTIAVGWPRDQLHRVKSRRITPISCTYLVPVRSESTAASAAEKPEKNFKCAVCDKQFLGKLALEHHMALRHGQGKVPSARSAAGAPQSFQSLIDGYDARRIERIDRTKYSREPLIINGKPETEEERKARLKKVIEEREKLRHKSVSVTDIPVVLSLVEMWDNFSIKRQEECKNDLEEGEILPFTAPHMKYTPLTLEQINEYIQNRKKELGYDEDAHSWMSDGIPLGVFKAAHDKKREKQTEELQKVHFGSRQLNSMTEPNPYKASTEADASDLPFKCSKCGKGYRSKMSMEFHLKTTCKRDNADTRSDKSDKNDPSNIEYAEGRLPSPRQPSSEERTIVNNARKDYPPKNPFQKESDENTSLNNDSPSTQSCHRQPIEERINTTLSSGRTIFSAKDIFPHTCATHEAWQVGNIMEDARATCSAVNPFRVKQEEASRKNAQVDVNESRMAVPDASNPFKQAALGEGKRQSDGLKANTGLANEYAYTKIMGKIDGEDKAGRGVNETANAVLESTIGSQHRMLRSFSSTNSAQQNPFKSFTSGAQPEMPTAPAAPQSKAKNPFASFSASPPLSPQLYKPSSSGPTMTAKTSSMNAPSYSVFAEGKSLQPPNATAPNANPFLRSFPFGRGQQTQSVQRSEVSCDATSNDTTQKPKHTCPQCRMAFRLQRALDAHISTSHTVASSLYTDPSCTESNDTNPFQPTGVKPTIPVDPFAD